MAAHYTFRCVKCQLYLYLGSSTRVIMYHVCMSLGKMTNSNYNHLRWEQHYGKLTFWPTQSGFLPYREPESRSLMNNAVCLRDCFIHNFWATYRHGWQKGVGYWSGVAKNLLIYRIYVRNFWNSKFRNLNVLIRIRILGYKPLKKYLVRKTLISTFCDFFMTFYLWRMM